MSVLLPVTDCTVAEVEPKNTTLLLDMELKPLPTIVTVVLIGPLVGLKELITRGVSWMLRKIERLLEV